jgi:hypothetical protein
MPISD